DRLGSFPIGYQTLLAPNTSEIGPGWGWAAYLLDDLEQNNLKASIRFDKDIKDSLNADARVTIVPVYVCPSEVLTGTFNVIDATGNPLVEVARGSYVAMNGILGVSEHSFDNNGPFLRNKRLRIADIKDGLSNTLFIGERCTNMSSTTWT